VSMYRWQLSRFRRIQLGASCANLPLARSDATVVEEFCDMLISIQYPC
jgi:hypothetical protein